MGQAYHSAGSNGFDGLVRITTDENPHSHGVGNLEPTLTVLLLEWQPKYLNIIGITVSSNAEIAVDTSLGILGNLVQIPPSR